MKNLLAVVLLKHLYHSRHQALNCIGIVGNHVATKGLKNACLHQFQNLITIKLIMTSALKALGREEEEVSFCQKIGLAKILRFVFSDWLLC